MSKMMRISTIAGAVTILAILALPANADELVAQHLDSKIAPVATLKYQDVSKTSHAQWREA